MMGQSSFLFLFGREKKEEKKQKRKKSEREQDNALSLYCIGKLVRYFSISILQDIYRLFLFVCGSVGLWSSLFPRIR